MLKKIQIILMSLVAALGLLSLAPAVMAQNGINNQCANSPDPVQCGLTQAGEAYPAGAKTANADLQSIIHKVINWALYLAAIIAVIYVIYGGFQYITSAGNATQAKTGATTVTNALIGLAIIVLSYLIVQVVYRFLVS